MRYVIVLALAAFALTACSSRQLEKPRTGKLADRVGGSSGIAKIVGAFHSTLVKDDQLKMHFRDGKPKNFRESMTAFLCQKIKATCAEGTSEDEAKVAVLFTGDEFEMFVQLFIVAMNDTELPQQEQNDLLQAMMAMRSDVVLR